MKQYITIISAILLPLSLCAQHTISGQIVLPNLIPVCDVLVYLEDGNGQVIDQEMSLEDGVFSFDNLPDGVDYNLRFHKEDVAANGTSTLDLVLIARFILGIATPTEYDKWAADVNGSLTVTTLDLLLIRKVILGVESNFSNTSNWVFIQHDAAFAGGDEGVQITNLNADVDLDVVAIKKGDINESAIICE